VTLEFEWDREKERANRKKHRVSFQEAATAFSDPRSVTFYDPDHSDDEDRYITIGTSETGRLVIISHTDRDDRIRIISARQAARRERKIYENG
jgi:uncharacterized DUF497 family protein